MTIPKRTKRTLNAVKPLELHRRMVHACLRAMRHIVGSNIGLSPIKCEICMQVFPPNYKWNSRSTYESAGTKLHADLNGPYDSCFEGHCYVLVLIDEGNRFIWSFPMKEKSDAPSILTNHIDFFRRRNGITVSAVRSDGDSVWGRLNLHDLERSNGNSRLLMRQR
jgi:transposase InsO family protein